MVSEVDPERSPSSRDLEERVYQVYVPIDVAASQFNGLRPLCTLALNE